MKNTCGGTARRELDEELRDGFAVLAGLIARHHLSKKQKQRVGNPVTPKLDGGQAYDK